MDKYNYYAKVSDDIITWIGEYDNSFDISQFENREEAAEWLEDELWAEDSITGNGSFSYATEELCEEFLCHNLDLVFDACDIFGVDYTTLRKQYKQGILARYLDCTVRCYVLPTAIHDALKEWESYGYKYKKS